jgi:hypothetical protein
MVLTITRDQIAAAIDDIYYVVLDDPTKGLNTVNLLTLVMHILNRTEQLRKLGKLLSYYLDKFNHNGVFIRHKQKMQSSVAVGTMERGRSPSRDVSVLGIVQTT